MHWKTYAAALDVEGGGRVLDGGRDDLLNLLVGDGGVRADGVDGAACLDGLQKSSRARHVRAELGARKRNGGAEAGGEKCWTK